VDVSSFFQEVRDFTPQVIFTDTDASEIQFSNLPKGSVRARLLAPADTSLKTEPYLIEIPPRKNLNTHFFYHKGEEIGYLLSGKLQLKIESTSYTINAGDVVYLTTEIPSHWKNPGPGLARLLWFKIK
jgi:quercetin dioxygenase-like cupin family protein